MTAWTSARTGAAACIEVTTGSACIESGSLFSACRHPKHPHAPAVLIRATGDTSTVVAATPDEWAAFVAAVKAGEFDQLIDTKETT